MTPEIIGLLIGAAFGIGNWFLLKAISGRVEKPETVRVLRIVGALDLVILPAIGYVIGLAVFGEPGTGAAP